MVSIPSILLNPCDYLYYAQHQFLSRTTGNGANTFLVIEVAGHPNHAQIRRALAETLVAHPTLSAPLRVSLLTGWPGWRPITVQERIEVLLQQAYTFEDLRSEVDARCRLETLLRERSKPEWNLTTGGPHIRLEQYALPENLSVFCLRWPHFVMDAEGAQLLLAEIGDYSSQSTGPSVPDQPLDILAGISLRARWRLFRQGFALNPDMRQVKVRPLIAAPSGRLENYGLHQRSWRGDDYQRIKARAESLTPPGSGLYARFFACGLIRALHAVFQRQGVSTGGYLITFPMRVPLRPECLRGRSRRPFLGNYLVSPILCARRELVEDRTALAADLQRQLRQYYEVGGDLQQWAMAWMASFLRASMYPWLLKLPLGFEALSSGFSYYPAFADPPLSFCGCPATEVWGGGPLGTPPGWNPVFMRYRDRFNYTLTWNRPDIPDEFAALFTAEIEREVLSS